jgi:ADP-heptose:LPS heptosyltransferase
MRCDRIGDMKLSTPALRAMRKHFPRARLTVLAGPPNQGVLVGDAAGDEMIIFDDRSTPETVPAIRWC